MCEGPLVKRGLFHYSQVHPWDQMANQGTQRRLRQTGWFRPTVESLDQLRGLITNWGALGTTKGLGNNSGAYGLAKVRIHVIYTSVALNKICNYGALGPTVWPLDQLLGGSTVVPLKQLSFFWTINGTFGPT